VLGSKAILFHYKEPPNGRCALLVGFMFMVESEEGEGAVNQVLIVV
jgi:hypothetical protein